jgi:hypothetical protein
MRAGAVAPRMGYPWFAASRRPPVPAPAALASRESMSTFEITIERQTEAGWPIVVERTSPGAVLRLRAEGILHLGPDTGNALLAAMLDPRAYGEILGQALFCDDIRDAFTRARAETADDDRLRVLLTVEDPVLRGYRWERLCAPLDGDWDLLALNQEVPFSLYLPSITDRRFPPVTRRQMAALIVAASPVDLGEYALAQFDVVAAVAGARTALGDIESDVLATGEGADGIPGLLGPATLDALTEQITAGAYTVLHVVGHGSVATGAGDGETRLYLARTDGTVDAVTGTRLLERLGRLGALPRFVFLSACETASATAEAAGGLGGLAQRLVRELGMPAVVAMTDKVTVATAVALAEPFYRQLREHGHPDLALVAATAGLAERGDITVPALYSRLAGLPLFSDTVLPLQDLTPEQIAHGLDRAAPLLEERAPVLIADTETDEGARRGFASLARTLRDLAGADSATLSPALRDERRRALEELDAICTEALDMNFAALAVGQTPPLYDARPPFLGLKPFLAKDRPFFFGRDDLVAELQARLGEHPFLPVLGPSGSGKSSVVLAGLVPALAAAAGETEPYLERHFRPGDEPLARLDETLQKLAGAPGPIVVDQFEEIFTLCRDDAKRAAFFERLLALTAQRPVLLTMRADFWGDCAPYPALRTAMEAHQRLIAPMDAGELRKAIEKQAAAVGLRFEADLAASILDQVQGEPGAMPLLQHALLELWNRRHGRWLLAAEYRALGGVQGAIAKTAETVYAELTEPDKERMRDIFVRLTKLDEDATAGTERRDTRRRVALEELVPAGGDVAATKALVARLASKGLVVTSWVASPPAPASG